MQVNNWSNYREDEPWHNYKAASNPFLVKSWEVNQKKRKQSRKNGKKKRNASSVHDRVVEVKLQRQWLWEQDCSKINTVNTSV